MSGKIRKEDVEDLDFVDRDELRSDGTLAFKSSVTVTSTDNTTKRVAISGWDLVLERDTPLEPGDVATLSGTSGADGTYTVNSVIGSLIFDVVEAIASSTGGSVSFAHAPGARQVGFNPSGLVQTSAINLQDAIKDLDTAITGGGLTEAQHKALLQLIHFIDEGPAEGFTTGATKTVTGTVFPTQVLWKRADATKLVEKNITWTGVVPTTIQWKIYAADGSTVLATVTDTISYSGIFETGRARAIA